jgi:hypothetical protein
MFSLHDISTETRYQWQVIQLVTHGGKEVYAVVSM